MIPSGEYKLVVETNTDLPLVHRMVFMTATPVEKFRERALGQLRRESRKYPIRRIHENTLKAYRITTKYTEVEL